jgi:hypothetical protein
MDGEPGATSIEATVVSFTATVAIEVDGFTAFPKEREKQDPRSWNR